MSMQLPKRAVGLAERLVTRRLTALALCFGSLAACSSSDCPEGMQCTACYSGTDSAAMCVEQVGPPTDLSLAYAITQCQQVSGKLSQRCPTQNLVGSCDLTATSAKGQSSGRAIRTFQYLHPQLASEQAIASISQRCTGGRWTPAVSNTGPRTAASQ